MAKEFTDANFVADALGSDKVVMVDLWAEWCGPCKMMGPIVDELATELGDDAVIGKMDVDANSETPSKYNVRGIPTFLFFKGGELVDKQVGAVPKAKLVETLQKYM